MSEPNKPLAGESDADYQRRIDTARLNALWKVKTERKPSDLSSTPLFNAQERLFDD